MQDPHHHGGQQHHHQHNHHHHHHHQNQQQHHGHEAHGAGREDEEGDHLHSHLQPPATAGAQSDSGSDSSLPQSRSVEFDLPSPVSPARPKSPWGRFDPYDNNEVK